MKLSKLQKHYQDTFNKLRRHVSPFRVPIYVKIQDTNFLYEADKRTKQYAKYLGVKILLATSYSNEGKTKYSLQTKAPRVLDVICNINNVPCLIVFVNNDVHAIHMGYNPISDTFDDHVVLQNEGIIIPSTSVRGLYTEQHGLQFIFQIVANPMHNMHNEQDMDGELNDIVHMYNITEKPITEELQFQLDTIVQHTQYYLPVYQRAIQMQRKLNSLKEQGKNCTVLHLLRYAAGL